MSAKALNDYEHVSVREEELPKPVDFSNLFGRNSDVHIEVGSGKGTFLVNEAPCQPEADFLGIEWANKYYRYAVDRIGRRQLSNVRIIRTDVAGFLAEYVADSSVAFFHVYFPDPWPKKRHHKRRFISRANACQMIRCLHKGGVINVATDHEDYFRQIEGVFGDYIRCGVISLTEFVRSAGAGDNEVVGTNYERKYIKADKPIYTIAVRRV